MKPIIYFIVYIISRLPLPLLNFLGNIGGNCFFYTSRRLRDRTLSNLALSGLVQPQNLTAAARKVTGETVKTALEFSIALMRPPAYIQHLFHEINGQEYLSRALHRRQGLLLMTPHLGSFDLAGRMIAELLPVNVTVLYKPAKFTSLNELILAGRERNNVTMASATTAGVAKIIRALKRHEAVMMLPDQVPEAGEGMVVNFFNQPAYTMKLAAKLACYPEVTPLFFVGERLARGSGFKLRIYPLTESLGTDVRANIQLLNRQIEQLIRQFPEQYLFSYNRYKIPAGCEHK